MSSSNQTRMTYKLRRMWTTRVSNLEKCGSTADCAVGTPVTTANPFTYDINASDFTDTAR